MSRDDPRPETGGDSGDSEATGSGPVAAVGAGNGSCRHRVRWRDLKASRKALFAVSAPMVALSGATAVAGLIGGLALAVLGMEGDPDVDLALAAFLVVESTLLLLGTVVVIGTWRRLHRPEGAAFTLGSIGSTGAIAVTILVAVFADRYVLLLAMIPVAVVCQLLGYFRLVLNDRSTCDSHPELPPHIRAMLKAAPAQTVAAKPPPPAAGDTYSIEACGHTVKLGDLKPKYLVAGVLGALVHTAYAAMLVYAMIAVLGRMGDTSLGVWTVFSMFGVLVAVAGLNLAVAQEYTERSKRLHKSPLGLHVWALIGYAATAAMAAWFGSTMDSPLFWVWAALAVYLLYGSAAARADLTHRAECRSNPELPPKVRDMLKAG